MGAPLSAVRNRRNSRGVRWRRDRIPGDGLAGRGGDHRDHRRIGRLLRGGLAVRPVAFYVGPLIFHNTIAGWILAKLVSDLAFYLFAIVSYERFNGLLVRVQPRAEEVPGECVVAIEAA
jgi:hypothetical protein